MTRTGSEPRHHGDSSSKIESEFPADNNYCLNCCRQLSVVCSEEDEDPFGAGVVAFTSFVKNAKTQVFIADAVKEIYSVLYAVDLQNDVQACALCVDCSLIFAQLFGLLQTFESRRKADGFLDIALTKGIQWASDFTKNKTGSSNVVQETDDGTDEDDFISKFEKFADGFGNENKVDSADADSQGNESADIITVRSVRSPKQPTRDDDQRAQELGDGVYLPCDSDVDDSFPLASPLECDVSEALDSDEVELENVAGPTTASKSVDTLPEVNSKSTGNNQSSSEDLKPRPSKSRRIDENIKSENNITDTPGDMKLESEESDYAPTASSSESSDDGNDAQPTLIPSRLRKRKPRASNSARNYIRKNSMYKCADCPEEFHKPGTLAEHRQNVHNTSEAFKCHICFKTFAQGYTLKAHLLRHQKDAEPQEKDKIFKCIDCGERFAGATEFGRHRIDLHRAVNNPYVCHICLYSPRFSSLLKPHILRHISTEEHKCSECEKIFKVFPDLQDHMFRVHQVAVRKNHNRPFGPSVKVLTRCRKCDAEFDSSEKLFEHSTALHGDELFHCEICKSIFFTKERLTEHMRKHGKPKLQCKFCDRKLHTQSQKNFHEMYGHEDVRSTGSRQIFAEAPAQVPPTAGAFQCTQCPLTFDTGNELAIHVECRHKPAGAFRCDACPKSYITKKQLRLHQRQAHGQNQCQSVSSLECDVSEVLDSNEVDSENVTGSSAACKSADTLADVSSRSTGNYQSSSEDLKPRPRKSRRFDETAKTESNMTVTSSDVKGESEESDHAPKASSSESSDDDSDASPAGVPSRLRKRKARATNRGKAYNRNRILYKCTDCPKEFHKTSTLSEHRQKAHSTSEVFKCHICLKTFQLGPSLKRHLLCHPKVVELQEKDKIFKCIDCGERFAKVTEFGRHRVDLHGAVNNPYVCHICLYNPKNLVLLKPHILRHISTEEHKCSECGKIFKVFPDLQYHMFRVHQVVVRKNASRPCRPSVKVLTRCRKCDAEFDSSEKLLEHSTAEHGEELFHCEICKSIFFGKKHLTSHMRIHEKPKLQCKLCDRKFRTPNQKKYHEMYGHEDVRSTESRQNFSEAPAQVPPTAGAFQCTECPLTFDTDNELSIHVECRHKTAGAFRCDVCSKSYITKTNLRSHQRAAHGQNKCLQCNEMIKKGGMAKHLAQSHRKHKPVVPPSVKPRRQPQRKGPFEHPCSDCPEKFERLKDFVEHRKAQHNVAAEDIYKCIYCHKNCGEKGISGNFRDHLDRHNESTDWPCAHCSLRFRMRTHRNEHQLQVHGPQPDDDPEGMLPLPPERTLQFVACEEVSADVRKSGTPRTGKNLIFKCVDCDQEFNRPLQLGNHRALLHGCEPGTRLKCHICLKFCPSVAALYGHVKRHYAEPDQLCHVCSKTFRMPEDLKQHYRLNHTEDEQKQLREKWKRWRDKKAAEKRGENTGQD